MNGSTKLKCTPKHSSNRSDRPKQPGLEQEESFTMRRRRRLVDNPLELNRFMVKSQTFIHLLAISIRQQPGRLPLAQLCPSHLPICHHRHCRRAISRPGRASTKCTRHHPSSKCPKMLMRMGVAHLLCRVLLDIKHLLKRFQWDLLRITVSIKRFICHLRIPFCLRQWVPQMHTRIRRFTESDNFRLLRQDIHRQPFHRGLTCNNITRKVMGTVRVWWCQRIMQTVHRRIRLSIYTKDRNRQEQSLLTVLFIVAQEEWHRLAFRVMYRIVTVVVGMGRSRRHRHHLHCPQHRIWHKLQVNIHSFGLNCANLFGQYFPIPELRSRNGDLCERHVSSLFSLLRCKVCPSGDFLVFVNLPYVSIMTINHWKCFYWMHRKFSYKSVCLFD